MDRIEQLKKNQAELKIKLADNTLDHEQISQLNAAIRDIDNEILAHSHLSVQPKAEVPGSTHHRATISYARPGQGHATREDRGGGS